MAIDFSKLTPAQALMSMYVVGHAESDLAWDGHNYYANVNYGDPLTIWMLQYAGVAAYDAISWARQQGSFGAYIDTLPSEFLTWSRDQWKYATWTQSILDEYRDSIKANADAAKTFQVSLWALPQGAPPRECLEGYINAINISARKHGITLPETLTADQLKVLFYYIARWHNSPANAEIIFLDYGLDVSLETLRDAFIALYQTFSDWDLYGEGWTNAINLNYRDLVNWDGTSAPDFEGTIDSIPSGTPGGGSSGNASNHTPETSGTKVTIKEIVTNGQNLIIRSMEGTNILCIQAQGGNVWIPRGSVFDSTPGGQTGPGSGYIPLPPTDLEAMQRVMQWYLDHEEVYGYTQADGMYEDPDSTGLTNCSALIIYAARQLFPDGTLASVGMSTLYMAEYANEHPEAEIAIGSSWDPFPYEKSQPGDLLLVNHSNYYSGYGHVELYLGTAAQGNITGSELWGAGSAPAPHRNHDAGSYTPKQHDWRLVRIPWDK